MNLHVRIVCLFSIIQFSPAHCFSPSSCQLKLRDEGKPLSCLGDAGDIPVKRLSPKQEFQGFGFVDDHTVFFARSDGDSEPGTALCIFDLGQKRQRRIGALGATTDSRFDLDRATGLVAFNWYDGIYIFPVWSAMALPDDANFFSDFEKLLVKIAPCSRCAEPHWVSSRTISYVDLDDGRRQVRSAIVPR